MQQPELIPHLFRTEFSKITAVLCKQFGTQHMEVAEDIARAILFLASNEAANFITGEYIAVNGGLYLRA